MALKASGGEKKECSVGVSTARQIATCQDVLPFSLTGSLVWLLRSLTDDNKQKTDWFALVGWWLN